MQQKKCCRRFKYFKRNNSMVLHLMVATIAKVIIVENPRMRANIQPAAGTITNC
jgi:hypothetical protein